jgi:hypothetical protein
MSKNQNKTNQNLNKKLHFSNTIVSPSYNKAHPIKGCPLIRPNFRCNEIVRYYIIIPSREATPIKGAFFYFRKGCLIRGGLLYIITQMYFCSTYTTLASTLNYNTKMDNLYLFHC